MRVHNRCHSAFRDSVDCACYAERVRNPALAAILVLLAAAPGWCAQSPAPFDFAGIPLGTTLKELKERYPQVSRNPDSDRKFQVYQVSALKEVSEKSAGAFSIYKGRVVGGQVLLNSYNAKYWFDRMEARYGQPDSCTYCNDPELVRAHWSWPNGTTLEISGEMLTELTAEGRMQRQAWLARGDSDETADTGDEQSDLADAGQLANKPAHKAVAKPKRPPARVVITEKPTGWRSYYASAKQKLSRWLGWEK